MSALAWLLAIGGCFTDPGAGATRSDSEEDTAAATTTSPTDATGDPIGQPCDLYAQDCPPQTKCAPYIADGDGRWDDAFCVDVVDDPGEPGEECDHIGPESGLDTCDVGLVCWDIGYFVCIPLCGGSPTAPVCSGSSACLVEDGLPSLCAAGCDPFKACAGGELCVPLEDTFVCSPDASGDAGQVFDTCQYPNECDPGLVCIDAVLADECDLADEGCCLPFCDLTAPACPGVGQECLPWFDEETPPPGYESLGVCGVDD